jgi:DNA-binding MarR family transcriptional regulator
MDKINQAQQLRELIRKLERRLGVLEENTVSCCQVSLAQCHALVEIGRTGHISLGELAKLLNLETSTMSRTVNNLVSTSLVQRDIDTQDRRYITISLTESGNKIYQTIEKDMTFYFQDVFDSIPKDKQVQVLESMDILLEALCRK